MKRRTALLGMLATMAGPALAQNKFPIFTVNSPLTWLPLISGTAPSIYADFTTEGTTNHYYTGGSLYGSFAALLAALGGEFDRAGPAYYTNSSGLLANAGSNVQRFDYNSVTLTSNGTLLEGASTNLALWSRDLTNVAWTKSNATAALDQTGADGTATSASSLLATAGNATCLQTITQSSTSDTFSVYLKILVGTGEIDITLDGGSTWTNVTSQLNSSTYTRVSHNQTVTNSQFGVRLVTNGDKVAVDFNQIEALAFASSPILTTTVSVARAADNISVPWTATTATFFVQTTNATNTGGNDKFVGTTDASSDGPLFSNQSNSILGTYDGGVVLTKTLPSGNFSGTHKSAAAGTPSARSLTVDGATPASDASALFGASPTSVLIGNGVGGQIYGDMMQFGAWTVAASSARLQSLTG